MYVVMSEGYGLIYEILLMVKVMYESGENPYEEVELVASKHYHPTGVVTINIYHKGIYYVILSDGESEQPLLDSRSPDVSEKGRGYQLQSYPEGVEGWKELRKGLYQHSS